MKEEIFQVEITEISSIVVSQAAGSQEEADKLVRRAYRDLQIILGPEACKEVIFRPYKEG